MQLGKTNYNGFKLKKKPPWFICKDFSALKASSLKYTMESYISVRFLSICESNSNAAKRGGVECLNLLLSPYAISIIIRIIYLLCVQ